MALQKVARILFSHLTFAAPGYLPQRAGSGCHGGVAETRRTTFTGRPCHSIKVLRA